MLQLTNTILATSTSSLGSVTTAALTTTQTNLLILAFVSCGGSAVQGIAGVTGAGLSFANVITSNGNTLSGNTATVWSAWSPAVISAQTFNATSSGANNDMAIAVIAISGADSSGTKGSGAIGATNTNTFVGAAPSIALTTTRANSWCFSVGSDGSNNSAVTVGTNQTSIQSFLDGTGFVSLWCQRQNNLTSKVGTVVTMNNTAPAADSGNYGAIEVLPAMPSFQPNKLRPHAFSPGLAR